MSSGNCNQTPSTRSPSKQTQCPVSTILRSYCRNNSSIKPFSLSPSRRGVSLTIEKSILDKSIDSFNSPPSSLVQSFWSQLRPKFELSEVLIDFFFIKRNDDIGYEEFKDSCDYILTESLDLSGVFLELSDKNNRITKEDFIRIVMTLERNNSLNIIALVRQKLKKKYKNYQQAFADLGENGFIKTEHLFYSLGVKSQADACSTQHFTSYMFKKFWYNNENLCRVDSCIERIEEYEYCDKHFKGIILRGEEALGKISASVAPNKCVEVLTSLLVSLKNNCPFVGTSAQKRDVQALQLYLKYKQDKKVMSMSNTPCLSSL